MALFKNTSQQGDAAEVIAADFLKKAGFKTRCQPISVSVWGN